MKNNPTKQTYNNSAQVFSDYFATIGSRVWDIEKAISYLDLGTQINAFELGCGDGRDGSEISKRVNSYLGIDYSEGMIAIAKTKHPKLNCVVGDMLEFNFPAKVDIIFAFASILHLDKDQVKQIMKKCANSLKTGGILYISSKYMSKYDCQIKVDKAGKRQFYYYNPDLLLKLGGNNFRELFRDFGTKNTTEWFTQAFQKI